MADPAFMHAHGTRPTEDAEFLKAIFERHRGVERLAYERARIPRQPGPGSIAPVGGGAKNGCGPKSEKRRLAVPFLRCLSEEAAAGAARLALSGAKEAGVL